MKESNLAHISSKKGSSAKNESFLFGAQDQDKIEAFEKRLGQSMLTSDSISEAVEKVVEAALVSEFGIEITSGKQFKNMAKTISCGIMGDSELRRQALIIIDRFSKSPELNA
jgi:hypothetical protein